MNQAIEKREEFSLRPTTMAEAMEYAKLMASSELVPKEMRGKPADVMIAVQLGAEVGFSPVQALQHICVINGRPTIWGDGALGLVQASGLMENFQEWDFEQIAREGKAVCWSKRKGVDEPIIRSFSLEDAKRAGLLTKPIWQGYLPRMLQMRARAFNLRDGYSDVLKGLSVREEVEDYEDIPIRQAPPMPRRLSEKKPPVEPKDKTSQASPSPSIPTVARQEAPKAASESAAQELPAESYSFGDAPGAWQGEAATPTIGEPASPVISEGRRKRLYAIWKTMKVPDDKAAEVIAAAGYTRTTDIQVKDYETLVSAIESWTLAEHANIVSILTAKTAGN